MAEVEYPATPLGVMVEHSPDARLFIELSSHAAELTEAHHALELALQEHDPGSTLADAGPYLVGFAVVAYGRSILHSMSEDARRITSTYLITSPTCTSK